MKIITVIPLKKGTWKENLTYFSAKDIANGSIVVVPLRNKKVLGLVISGEDIAFQKSSIKDMSFNLKKVTEVKERSIFLKDYLDSAIEISRYSAGSKSNGIASLIPAPLRDNYDKLVKLGVGHPIGSPTPSFGVKHIKCEKLLFQAPFDDRISTYKTLIRESFAKKKSVFIVLPTVYDIKIFEESLSRGIEQFIFTVHGGMSEKKIIQKFEEILAPDHPVLILGTAPFLSIPRPDIGTIVVEHESGSAYKMIGKPYFDLRLFAELFAAKIKARFILSDTLLRFETIGRRDIDGFQPLHPMQFRNNFGGQIEIMNPKALLLGIPQSKALGFRVLTDESTREIKNAIAENKNVFIFSLRKGLASMTVCKDCNDTVSCEKCGAPLVLYLSHQGKKRMFVCNRCQEEKSGDTACASCGSWNLMPLGIGTDTVYEYVKEIFPHAKIFKLDKDSVKNTKGAEKIIKEFEEPARPHDGSGAGGSAGSILIGTEMAFFYFKNKVPLSIIASFDSLWSIPNFKMGEKIIQIVLSITNNTTEKFIIQTKNEKDSAVLAIKSENLLSFVREELEDRKKLEYPPYKRFVKITYLGDREQTVKAKNVMEEIFKEYNPLIFSGFVARMKDKYVTNALVKMDPKKWSLPEISTGSSIDESLLAKLSSLPPSFKVIVDPEDLL